MNEIVNFEDLSLEVSQLSTLLDIVASSEAGREDIKQSLAYISGRLQDISLALFELEP